MKKGQLTIFMLMGLVVLIGALVFIYIEEEVVTKEVEQEVDPEVVPIQRWVNDCIIEESSTAIRKIAQTGGYLSIPEEIRARPGSYLALDPNAVTKIPYWDYKGENRIPPVEYLEVQIEAHLLETIPACVGDFENFNVLYDIEAGEMEVDAIVAEEEVTVSVTYPLKVFIKAGRKSTSMEKFGAKIQAALGKTHKLAIELMETESQQMYMENITLDLMALHPDVPFTGLDFSCSPQQWVVDDVKEDVQEMLAYNFFRIRVDNTNYPPFEENTRFYERLRTRVGILREELENIEYFGDTPRDTFADAKAKAGISDDLPEDVYDYFHLFIPLEEGDDELQVAFQYNPVWGMRFRAEPSKGGVLRSNMAKGERNFLSFLCVNQFHFVYDVEYPILASVRDEDSFGGEGLTFNMAFLVQLDDSTPVRQPLGTQVIQVGDDPSEFCEDTSGEFVTIRAKGIGDFGGDEDIKDATIAYKCHKIFCELGTTEFVQPHYELSLNLPQGCSNPYLYATKDGYLDGKIQYTGGGFANVPITKLKEIPISVVKHEYLSKSDRLGEATVLEDDEKVVISISLKGGGHDQFVTLPSLQEKLELVEAGGEYDVMIMLIQEGKNFGLGSTDDRILGGYQNQKMTISSQALEGADALVFHVFDYSPTPIKMRDAAPMFEYMLEGDYLEALRPEFR
jgi:hypothetical protein